MDPGRRRHYGEFYGGVHGEDVAIVWGNCQAEALRVLLAGSPSFPLRTVRIPPVHEMVWDDLAPLEALLPKVVVMVSQPVAAGYRHLPLGTDEVAGRLAAHAKVVKVPIVRYLGLHPWAAIVRDPVDPALGPPFVPYHDLRTLALAAGRLRPRRDVDAATLRSIGVTSIAELARREGGTDVGVSDLLASFGTGAAHTLNHPGNVVLIALVRRVQTALCLPADAEDPGRELLGSIKAPIEPEVLDALGLDASPRPWWDAEGTAISPAEVEEAHLRWYEQHPGCVDAGLRRHADRLGLLGLL